jgi:TRAP-type C4-dicarboxylate transport system permease small subunit
MSEFTSAPVPEAYAPAGSSAADRALAPVRTLMRRAGLVMIAVMILLPALQVVLREVLGIPFVGAEELTRFMLICLVFVTFPYVVVSGANIRMEELSQYAPGAVRHVLHILIAGTAALVLAIAAASIAVATFRNLNNATPTLGIPYWVFFSAAFLGFFAAAVECALQLWKAILRRPLYVAFEDEASPDDFAELEAALVAPGPHAPVKSPNA